MGLVKYKVRGAKILSGSLQKGHYHGEISAVIAHVDECCRILVKQELQLYLFQNKRWSHCSNTEKWYRAWSEGLELVEISKSFLKSFTLLRYTVELINSNKTDILHEGRWMDELSKVQVIKCHLWWGDNDPVSSLDEILQGVRWGMNVWAHVGIPDGEICYRPLRWLWLPRAQVSWSALPKYNMAEEGIDRYIDIICTWSYSNMFNGEMTITIFWHVESMRRGIMKRKLLPAPIPAITIQSSPSKRASQVLICQLYGCLPLNMFLNLLMIATLVSSDLYLQDLAASSRATLSRLYEGWLL